MNDFRMTLELDSFLIGFLLGLVDDFIKETLEVGNQPPDAVLTLQNLLVIEFQKPYLKIIENEEEE